LDKKNKKKKKVEGSYYKGTGFSSPEFDSAFAADKKTQKATAGKKSYGAGVGSPYKNKDLKPANTYGRGLGATKEYVQSNTPPRSQRMKDSYYKGTGFSSPEFDSAFDAAEKTRKVTAGKKTYGAGLGSPYKNKDIKTPTTYGHRLGATDEYVESNIPDDKKRAAYRAQKAAYERRKSIENAMESVRKRAAAKKKK
jgi:hypothetical protein